MLHIKNVYFEYPDQEVLSDVSLSVSAGQLMHLKGQNGAGKSTLLKIIAGLLIPHEGHVMFENQSIYKNLLGYQRQLVYLGHKLGFHQLLTPNEVFELTALNDSQKTRIQELASQLQVIKYLDSQIHKLSAGTKRKIGLMMTLSSAAQIWLLDEPFVSLDEHAINVAINALIQHLNDGGTCIMTSHQMVSIPGMVYQEYQL